MRRPSNNPISMYFGESTYPYTQANPHKGVDFIPDQDPTIYAPASGYVVLIPNNGNDGNGIYLTAGGVYMGFLHTSKYLVYNNQYVKEGQAIAIMGNSGFVDPKPTPENPKAGTHLHWAAKVGSQFIDPLTLIKEEEVPLNRGDIINFWPAIVGHAPTDADFDAWIGQDFKQFVYDKVLPEVGSRLVNGGDLTNFFRVFLGHEPTQADLDVWLGKNFKSFAYDKLLPEAQGRIKP